jgi:hypothetical protein
VVASHTILPPTHHSGKHSSHPFGAT